MNEYFYRGARGKKFGIWNKAAKKFQFGICEDTPMLAMARLYQKIGMDARKKVFEPRVLSYRALAGLTTDHIIFDEGVR